MQGLITLTLLLPKIYISSASPLAFKRYEKIPLSLHRGFASGATMGILLYFFSPLPETLIEGGHYGNSLMTPQKKYILMVASHKIFDLMLFSEILLFGISTEKY